MEKSVLISCRLSLFYLILVVCNKKGSCWNNNSEHYITSYILLEQGLKLKDKKLTLKMFI